jgi:DNA (cytosine-5)-methyltransferase 1
VKCLPGQVALDLFGQLQVHPPEAYPWAGGLVLDYFAGGGGASTGLAQGLGRSPDVAINHNKVALAMHEANHPDTLHLHDDVWHVDPVQLTKGRPVLLLWGSPDCTDFSKAGGGKPVRKKIRGLAWVLHRFAGMMSPAIIMMENVEEFQGWGPLVAKRDKATGRVLKTDGTVAAKGERVPRNEQLQARDPKRGGATFRRFVRGLERKGYVVEWRVLRACDYGAPTSRRRLFLVARRDGLPIVWPAPTHGDPRSLAVQAGHLAPWRTAAECIDWSLPCPSIFGRKKPLADATLRRIAKGVMRYVVEAGDGAFVVSIDHQSSGDSAIRSADAPLSPVTSKARHALVVPTLIQTGYGERAGQEPRVPGLDKPLGTIVGGGVKHGLVAAFLAKHYGGVVGQSCDKPLGTVTAVDHHSVVAAHLVRLKGTCQDGQAIEEPVGSIQAQGQHWGLVHTFLVTYYGQGVATPLNEPLETITSKPRFGLVTIHGEDYEIVDIGVRMLQPHELYRAQGFPADYEHEWVVVDGERRHLTKAEQVAACGNSVSPMVVEALTRANVPRYAAERRAA